MKHEVPYRVLGHTGERVSAIGLGGWHLAFPKLDEQASMRIIRTAIDRGINFMDNSWDYWQGESERRMGKALGDGYRSRVFLMTKIDGRTRREATRQLDESLRRVLAKKDVADRIRSGGDEPLLMSAHDFHNFVADELVKMEKLVSDLHLPKD